MRTLVVLLTAGLLLAPFSAEAQDGRATLEAAAKALGATDLKSIEIQGGGVFSRAGQSQTPGMAWPQFNVRSFTRLVNYETASLRGEMVRTRTLEPPRGPGPYVRGEHTAVAVVSGDHAWNVMGENAVPAPIALGRPSVPALVDTPRRHQGPRRRTPPRARGARSRSVFPGSSRRRHSSTRPTSSSGSRRRCASPVLGDMPVTVSYADYRDFGA